jgi:hypothetical protein
MVGSPEAAAFLMAAPGTFQSDFGIKRARLPQFGRHRPRAALGAFFKQGIGFDHQISLAGASVHLWSEDGCAEFLFASALLAS